MLGQINIFGKDKVETAIERIRTFEPVGEGYYLAFSGGKDSVCVKALCDMAGVKYDAHYNITTVDPPELVQFVKSFPDVIMERARYSDGTPVTMWNLIPKKKRPPTRQIRYCCFYLKEHGGEGRFVITGVRHAESARRKNDRAGLELGDTMTGKRELVDPDNPSQELIHICPTKAQRVLNPIIDWTDEDVWEFIRQYNIPYCKLYDEGFKRLGCIGCPMAKAEIRKENFERYPKFRKAYIKAFERMLKQREERGLQFVWTDAEDVMRWWLEDTISKDDQINFIE